MSVQSEGEAPIQPRDDVFSKPPSGPALPQQGYPQSRGEQRPPMPMPPPPPPAPRPPAWRTEAAYVLNMRFKVANALTGLFAGLLIIFMIASYAQGQRVVSGGHSEWLLLARSFSEVRVGGPGFLIGPILIFFALPRARLGLRSLTAPPGQLASPPIEAVPAYGRGSKNRVRQFDRSYRVQFAYQKRFMARYVCTILLWVAGLVLLAAYVGGLGSAYTVKSGTYIAAALLGGGLLAAIAQWPARLPVEQVVKPQDIGRPIA